MCFATSPVAGVVRLRGVYTEPHNRGHGYATAMVAGATERLLRDGYQVALYTPLANPASNRIYQRLGYQVVSEILHYDFESEDG